MTGASPWSPGTAKTRRVEHARRLVSPLLRSSQSMTFVSAPQRRAASPGDCARDAPSPGYQRSSGEGSTRSGDYSPRHPHGAFAGSGGLAARKANVSIDTVVSPVAAW